MEHFLERLDTLLDADPFAHVQWPALSPNDSELVQKYRLRHVEERRRIREERKTKSFEEIMEDLLQELSIKPDISFFYRTLDDQTNSINQDVRTIELDTSDDEQDELDLSPHTDRPSTWIDPSKSIGHLTDPIVNELNSSTYMVYPLAKSPSASQSTRTIHRYGEQPRRNTYTLHDESSSNDEKDLMNTKHEYVRLDSQGFDPQQNLFNGVKDARSTFSVPHVSRHRSRFTREEAEDVLRRKLAALIKGHITRQLFRTEHVKTLIKTLHDTQKFAVDFQEQCTLIKKTLDREDIDMIDQLIRQVESVLDEIHAIFGQSTPARQIFMIRRNAHSQQLRATRVNQQIARDFSADAPVRPVVIDNHQPSAIRQNEKVIVKKADPIKRQTSAQSEYRRPDNIRRHVSAVPNRSVHSATAATVPLKKPTLVQRNTRKPRRLNSVGRESSASNPAQQHAQTRSASSSSSSAAASNLFRPPRLAPASPMFRNRLK